jgi:hypothetical protein
MRSYHLILVHSRGAMNIQHVGCAGVNGGRGVHFGGWGDELRLLEGSGVLQQLL